MPSCTRSICRSYVPAAAGRRTWSRTVAPWLLSSGPASLVRTPSHTNTAPLGVTRWYEALMTPGCHTAVPTLVIVTGTVIVAFGAPEALGAAGWYVAA